MERLIKIEKEEDEKVYIPLFFKLIIINVIIYILFLIIQIIDLFAEIINKDDDLFLFYYLRFIFFGVSILIQATAVGVIIVFFSIPREITAIKSLGRKIDSTSAKIFSSIYGIWTLFLLGSGIPRIIILMNNKEKIGKFISSLIYVKIFLLIPIYVNIILMYSMSAQNKKKED